MCWCLCGDTEKEFLTIFDAKKQSNFFFVIRSSSSFYWEAWVHGENSINGASKLCFATATERRREKKTSKRKKSKGMEWIT